MRITFQEIAVKGTRRWVDETGKKRQQTRKFYQTISPFNRAADGQLKTSAQMLQEVKAQRDAWLNERPVSQHNSDETGSHT